MSDRPPLHSFLDLVLNRLSQGEEEERTLPAWRNVARTLVADTLRVGRSRYGFPPP